MKKQWCALIWCLCLLAVLAGCGRVAEEGPASVPASSLGSGSSQGGVPSEIIPEDDPFSDYPYGIEGLTLYEPGEETQPGGLSLLGTVQNDATCRDGYFWLQGLYDLSGENILLIYSISDQQLNLEGDPYQDDIPRMEKYLASFDLETGEVTGTVPLPTQAGMAYTEQSGSVLWSWEQSGDELQATGYDALLQEVGHVTCEADTYGHFSPDGDSYYTVSDNTCWKRPSQGNVAAVPVTLEQKFSIYYMGGIFNGPEGAHYGIINGMASDLRTYQGIVNLDTGEFLYLTSDYNTSLYVDNGVLVCQVSSENGLLNRYVVYTGTTPYTYDWPGEEYLSLSVLSDGKLLFYYTETSESEEDADGGTSVLHMSLYDGNTGTLVGSTSLTADESYIWFNGAPVLYPGQDALLMPVGSAALYTWYYRWDYLEGTSDSESLTVTETQLPSDLVPELNGQWDPTSFVPQDCPEELSDLRAQADALEEQFGVRIYISTECRNILGGYAMEDLSDRDLVADSLAQLERELQKYPDGFFRQFNLGWLTGIDIYLTGTLIGTSSDILDYAGGFQTIVEDRVALAIDCTYPSNIATTLHHELSHAIDTKINMDLEGVNLDGEEWAALNPSAEKYGDSYTYTYTEFGRPEMQQFVYSGMNNESCYFVDNYSMTFPTEDRARLFENIMTDYSWVDWENTPHLRAKLNYFARCIRAAFDTTLWEDVPWERYLEEDEVDNAA